MQIIITKTGFKSWPNSSAMYQLIATFYEKERFANCYKPKKMDNYQFNLDIIDRQSDYRYSHWNALPSKAYFFQHNSFLNSANWTISRNGEGSGLSRK